MTKTLHFSTQIDAPRGTVWDTLIAPDSFKAWTEPFMPGSHFEGSWDKGATIRFLAPDGNGMSSVIVDNRPGEFISIKHLGEVREGVDDFDSDSVRRWAPAFENYTLTTVDGGTRIAIDVDVTPEYEQQMRDAWPHALDRLKALSEAR